MTPGKRLRACRLARGMTLRDVEVQSATIARKLKCSAYLVSVARLSEYERGNGAPSVFKMYSLATVFGCALAEVAAWYGIPRS